MKAKLQLSQEDETKLRELFQKSADGLSYEQVIDAGFAPIADYIDAGYIAKDSARLRCFVLLPGDRLKVEVRPIGYQIGIDDLPKFLLVNDPSGHTLKFNPTLHILPKILPPLEFK